MGRLISIAEFSMPLSRLGRSESTYDTFWFFADRRNPKLSDSFPHRLSIHQDYLEGGSYDQPTEAEAGKTRIEIRKWIESAIDSDVVWTNEGLTHVRVGRPYQGKRYAHTIAHGYYHFHFEVEQHAVGFRLMFGEIIRTPTEYHPRYKPEDGCDDFFGNAAHMRARELTGYSSLL